MSAASARTGVRRGSPNEHPASGAGGERDQDERCLIRPVRRSSQLSGAIRTLRGMTATLIGYARCSTDAQDLTAQRARLAELGVTEDRTYLDRGLTGTRRAWPGLDQALAAVRSGDTLVVPKLDRLARSVPDARDIADSLAARGVRLALGGTVYDPTDPTDPMGKMLGGQ